MLFRDKHEKEAIFWSMYLFHFDFLELAFKKRQYVSVYVIDLCFTKIYYLGKIFSGQITKKTQIDSLQS